MATGLSFNDTSGKQGLLQQCEFLLDMGDGTITGDLSSAALPKVFTRLINIWLHKIVTMILQSQDEWDFDDINNTDYPIATTSLVANQQDYTLPASLNILDIKRVDVSFDSGATWRRCNPVDVATIIDAADSTDVGNNFDRTSPFYDIEFNAIKLYPIPTANSTAGLKIWFYRTAIEFVSTDTTKVPPIDAPFHNMLAVGASYDYAAAHKGMEDKAERLEQAVADYEARLRLHYGSKEEDRKMNLISIYADGTYGN